MLTEIVVLFTHEREPLRRGGRIVYYLAASAVIEPRLVRLAGNSTLVDHSSMANVVEMSGADLESQSESLWWAGQIEQAIDSRSAAFRTYKKEGRTAGAVRSAAWLAREFHITGNDSASRGWLARAESTVEESTDRVWLLLEQSRRAQDPSVAADIAKEALALSKKSGDSDAELLAVAALGLERVRSGYVEEGKLLLDEAMAGATGGEANNASTLGEVLCATVAATSIAPDPIKLAEWNAPTR